MKISLNWLSQYIKIEESEEKLAELLTDTGLEVEGIEAFESVKGGLQGLVIGEVLTCEKHPNADKLNITTVDLGQEEPAQIVCGAPNVAAGQKVVVAPVNTTIFPTEGEPFKIKKAKIRGEVSFGMICAEDEIGLGKGHDGILVLDTDLPNGTPAAELFDVFTDTIYEIGLTPNRTDATSHIGTARDVKAVTGRGIHWPDVTGFSVDNHKLPIKVEVENHEACPRYSGISLMGVKVGPSPQWLQNRLKSIGLKPVNNVVDVTNFVLHEVGQPLHAFDAGKIKDNTIRVKTLKQDTKFVTLDDEERKLQDRDLMICDGTDEGLCIAGVFGGKGSGVTEKTENVFLESAYFHPDYIRKTAQHHGLKTDASFRYERGTDPNITVYALKRAASLIKEVAGGTISSEIVDIYPKPIEDFQVTVKYEYIDKLLGEPVEHDRIHEILNSLDIQTEPKGKEAFLAKVPPYRVDVQRPADIAEEIIRIIGLNNIALADHLESGYLAEHPAKDPINLQHGISQMLVADGYFEMFTNSLTKKTFSEKMEGFDPTLNVEIVNKLSEDLGVMRQALWFTGLDSIAHNINHRQSQLKFFEFGNVYQLKKGQYEQERHLALYLSGENEPENWRRKNNSVEFHDLYAVVLKIFNKLNGKIPETENFHNETFSFGLILQQEGREVGRIGKLSSKATKVAGIKQPVFHAVIYWQQLLAMEGTKITYEAISRFPEVRRDLSLVIDEKVSFEDIKQVAAKNADRILRSTSVFDVYRGENIEEGKKAYALSFILQDKEKTLTDKVIDKTMQRLMKAFEKELEAIIRQ